jgi:small subunit ribosomal protein S24e
MAEEPKFTIRLSKIKNNRVLDRLQMVVDVFYEHAVKVTKESIRKKIASQFKKNNVVIYSAKKAFGGGRLRCFAMVYDSEDSMKKYEPKKRLSRIEREKLPPKDRKVEKKKEGRKVSKVKKHQRQKKRGTLRRQNINLERKQKKKK